MKTLLKSQCSPKTLLDLRYLVFLFSFLSFSGISQDPECFLAWDSGVPTLSSPYCQDPNGTIEVSATGSGQVLYSINGGAPQNSGLFENLGIGDYTVTATDDLNCEISLNISLEGQQEIIITDISATTSECDNDTGTITITATGLGLRYSINGSAFQASNTFSNLAGGIYDVVVTDVNECIADGQISVPQGSITLNSASTTGTTCIESMGEILVEATGNSLQYRIEDLTGWQNTGTFTGLEPGRYWVEIRDSGGCILRKRYTVRNTMSYQLNITNPLCGEMFGEIVVNVQTSGNYEYSISGENNYQSGNVFTDLTVGNYTLLIRLVGTECVFTKNIKIEEEPDLTIDSINKTEPTCNSFNGSITVNTSGLGTPVEYIIESADYTATSATGVFDNVPQGNYTVTVNTSSGCSDTGGITLTDINDIVINGTEATSSTCISAEGTITVDAVSNLGSSLEYRVNDQPYTSSPLLQTLFAGPQEVSVRSSSGCVTTFIVTVPARDPIIIEEITTVVPVSKCTPDGSIELVVDGVDLEFSLNGVDGWQTSSRFEGLLAATYVVYIRSNATQCVTQTGEIELIGGFFVDTIETLNVFCDRPEGEVSIFAGGIDMMYRIDGGEFQSEPNFTGLAVGTHIVEITDSYGCIISEEVEITSSGNVSFSDYNIFYPECGDENAAIELFVETESSTIQYWKEGEQPGDTNIFYSLPRGITTFYARDEFGCTDTIEVNILETSQVINSAVVTDYVCFNNGGTVTIEHEGGLPPFTYSLDGVTYQSSNVFTGLNQGDYTLHVMDRAGCKSTVDAQVGYQCEALVPGSFTPNDDGTNDRLALLHERNLKINEFRVFNSWGELVYEKFDFWSNSREEFWSGVDVSGELGDQNVYLYEVQFIDEDGSEKTRSGVVTLVR